MGFSPAWTACFELQVLDPDNPPRFGQVIMPDNNRSSTTRPAVVTPGLLNPAYMNEALIRRAVIQSLSELVWMQGGMTCRTQTLKETSYPITGIIFSYNVLVAEQYYMLKDYVDEGDPGELWKQAVMCVADKLADFEGLPVQPVVLYDAGPPQRLSCHW